MASTINADNGAISGSAGVKTTADSSGVLDLQTNGTTRLTIDTSGNLGLGVTPSAWDTAEFRPVEMGTIGNFVAGYVGSSVAYIGTNAYYNGGWKYARSSVEAAHIDIGGGAFRFKTAGTGTAGNAITWTQAMTLDASGNLGVGTTTAPGANGGGIAIYKSDYPRLTFRNSTSGDGTGDGLQMALVGSDFTYDLVESGYQRWTTGGSERARISSGGSLLVGTNSDFAFSGTTFINSSTTNCIFANTTAGAGTGYLLFQGRSGAANVNTAGTTVFSVTDNGNVTNTNNSYGAISDEKLKQDIVDAASQWDDIKGLRVRKFRYKAAPAAPLQIGLIAQEAETVSPGLIEEIFDQEEVEVVDESGNVKKEARIAGTSTKSVKYSVLYMKAVKALQEAMSRIESLEAEVAALKAR